MHYLNDFFGLVVPLLSKHRGHANKFIGDGVLGVFGAPERLRDHADRALEAACEIAMAVEDRYGDDLRMGAGINSGPVSAGSVGGGGRLEFTVVGDAVNVASRVEHATRELGDRVLLTEATRCLLTRDVVPLEPRGAIPLKGKSEPVPIWAPDLEALRSTRFEDAAPALAGGPRPAPPVSLPPMSTEVHAEAEQVALHGGRLVAKRLKAAGVSKLFTLSGGHLFSIYDGCREEGIDIVDVRHEQSAAFAAEGWAKVTRELGVCALTAGPGVTNGMSAMASAQANHSPMVVLGGRAPAGGGGWARSRRSTTSRSSRRSRSSPARPSRPPRSPGSSTRRCAPRPSRPPAPRSWTSRSTTCSWRRPLGEEPAPAPHDPLAAPAADDGVALERAAELLSSAERPVVMAGTGLYWARGEDALRRLCAELQVPVFLNGLARGCVPADHAMFFSRARGTALKGADVALVIGVPMDFRLGFGGSFGDETRIVAIGSAPARAPAPARGRRGALRRRAGDARRAALSRGPNGWQARRRVRRGWRRFARSRTSAARRSSPSSPTRARRFTRCACTASSGRCSTATRSSSATAATSSPTRAA